MLRVDIEVHLGGICRFFDSNLVPPYVDPAFNQKPFARLHRRQRTVADSDRRHRSCRLRMSRMCHVPRPGTPAFLRMQAEEETQLPV